MFPRDIFGSPIEVLPWNSVQSYITEIERTFFWLSRSEAELSSDVVQAIPCVIIRDSDDKFCVLRRVEENRSDLSRKLSLIVGGHIDSANHGDCFLAAMTSNLIREIDEEIGICPVTPPRPIGVIIDGSSIEASRHIAFLHEMTADQVAPRAPEEFTTKSKYTGEFAPALQLREWFDRFDPWSRLVIEDYVCLGQGQLRPRQPSFL